MRHRPYQHTHFTCGTWKSQREMAVPRSHGVRGQGESPGEPSSIPCCSHHGWHGKWALSLPSRPCDQKIAIYSSISLAPFHLADSSGSARNLSTYSLLNTVTETNWTIHVLAVRHDFLKVSQATLAPNVLHTRKENVWTNIYPGGKLLHTNPSLHASSCLLKKSYWKHRVQ